MGPDILIHTEEVVGIVFLLYLLESFVVIPVGGTNPLVSFAVHHEVHVCPAGSKRMQCLPVIPGPLGNPCLVGWIGIDTDDHLAPRGLAITPWGIVLGSLVCSAVDGIQVHRRV